MSEEKVARRMWHLVEPVHAVGYFAPEGRAAADATGVRGFWMGYVAQRAAPLGAVSPGPVTAAFFGFHPSRIERALPDAWSFATPATMLAARLDGATAALRRVARDAGLRPGATDAEGHDDAGPDDAGGDDDLREAADLAGRAADAVDTAGRVLAAANRELARPSDPLGALWQATTTLREHRGDGHVAALVAHGVGPVAAHLLKAGAADARAEALRDTRHWPEDAWAEAVDELRARGVLAGDGTLTDVGRVLHAEIEDATDAAAEGPWRALGAAATDRLATLLAPWAEAVLTSGTVPVPNPMGLRPA